jgi:hypothetical protein
MKPTYKKIKKQMLDALQFATGLQKEIDSNNAAMYQTVANQTFELMSQYSEEIDEVLEPALKELTPKQLEILTECLRPETMQAFTKLNMAMLPITMKITTANLETLMTSDLTLAEQL